MSRNQRIKSRSGYYHIMLRGNERRSIFNDEADKLRFLETLTEKKQKNRFSLQAFCLMDNHVHLMLSEGTEDISKIIKRIAVSYVFYFNNKYKRIGHLFQDRFKSEVVEQDGYILALARYIHQNPVKAGMVKYASEYKWSSYNSYLDGSNYFTGIMDIDTILGILSGNRTKALNLYKKYMNEDSEDMFIEMGEEREIVDEEEAERIYLNMLHQYKIKEDDQAKTQLPNEFIKRLKDKTGLSIRRIAAITGQNKDKVNKSLKS